MILYLCGCCRWLLLLLRLPSILFGFVFRRYVCMWFIAVARIWIMPHVPNAHNPNVPKQNHHHKYTKYKCASFIQKKKIRKFLLFTEGINSYIGRHCITRGFTGSFILSTREGWKVISLLLYWRKQKNVFQCAVVNRVNRHTYRFS